jgi:hypothetical protein
MLKFGYLLKDSFRETFLDGPSDGVLLPEEIFRMAPLTFSIMVVGGRDVSPWTITCSKVSVSSSPIKTSSSDSDKAPKTHGGSSSSKMKVKNG